MTLNYPLLSLPCILVSPQATVAALFVCWLPSAGRGAGVRPNPQLLNQVSFSAFVNEKPVWVEVGLDCLWYRLKLQGIYSSFRGKTLTQFQRAKLLFLMLFFSPFFFAFLSFS